MANSAVFLFVVVLLISEPSGSFARPKKHPKEDSESAEPATTDAPDSTEETDAPDSDDTTTTVEPDEACENDRIKCEKMALKGACEDKAKKHFMKKYCKAACELCDSPAGSCFDLLESCLSKKLKGECKDDTARSSCRKTCGYCHIPTPPKCVDKSADCPQLAAAGSCSSNLKKCAISCGQCSVMGYPNSTATNKHSCTTIRQSIPQDMRIAFQISKFYSKYTEAYGIPIVGSSKVNEAAMKRVCYVVRFVYADRPDLRTAAVARALHFVVAAESEPITTIPEIYKIRKEDWDGVRGYSGSISNPSVIIGEDRTAACDDDYHDTAIHEASHSLMDIAAKTADPDLNERIASSYDHMMEDRIWKDRDDYAEYDKHEHWAEANRIYFDEKACASGLSKDSECDTTKPMSTFDPEVYKLIKEAHPCNNPYIAMCEKSQDVANRQILRQLIAGACVPMQ